MLFQQLRESLLNAIRAGDLNQVKTIGQHGDMSRLARAKNYYGRCSLHVAVLLENEEMVEYLASNIKGTLHVGDNLARTALHYAMGINSVEAISRILIRNGAKRVVKDLKGRQPSVSLFLICNTIINKLLFIDFHFVLVLLHEQSRYFEATGRREGINNLTLSHIIKSLLQFKHQSTYLKAQ